MQRFVVFDIETKDTFFDVSSNDPRDLHISMVGVYDSNTEEYSSYMEHDLAKLWPILEHTDILIGFNSDHFDIPLLDKYYPGDLTKIKSIDLLKEFRKQAGRSAKLDQIAEGTLGVKKSGHGLQAIEWWKKGDIESIRKYCLDDVKITKEVYEYAKKNKKLTYKEGGKKFDVKIDPTNWDIVEKSSITHTLPF